MLNIKNYRKSKNLTQDRVAELSNVHRTYICKFEANIIKPNINKLIDIYRAMGANDNEIIDWILDDIADEFNKKGINVGSLFYTIRNTQ